MKNTKDYLNRLFPPNDFFEYYFNHEEIYRVLARINRIELAMKYTKKSVQKIQNKKNFEREEFNLKMVVYKHNSGTIFVALSEELDKRLYEAIEESLENIVEVRTTW